MERINPTRSSLGRFLFFTIQKECRGSSIVVYCEHTFATPLAGGGREAWPLSWNHTPDWPVDGLPFVFPYFQQARTGHHHTHSILTTYYTATATNVYTTRHALGRGEFNEIPHEERDEKTKGILSLLLLYIFHWQFNAHTLIVCVYLGARMHPTNNGKIEFKGFYRFLSRFIASCIFCCFVKIVKSISIQKVWVPSKSHTHARHHRKWEIPVAKVSQNFVYIKQVRYSFMQHTSRGGVHSLSWGKQWVSLSCYVHAYFWTLGLCVEYICCCWVITLTKSRSMAWPNELWQSSRAQWYFNVAGVNACHSNLRMLIFDCHFPKVILFSDDDDDLFYCCGFKSILYFKTKMLLVWFYEMREPI